MKVYVALYTECKYESDYGVISIHTKERYAKAAIRKHRRREYNYRRRHHMLPIREWQQWYVKEYEVER